MWDIVQPQKIDRHRAALAWKLVAAIATSPFLIACTSVPQQEIVIHASPKGSVSLRALPDRSFKATHPLSLESAIIARVLRGIQVQEQRRLLQALLAGGPTAAQAFSDDDTDFLAPLIATALSKATPPQEVAFRVVHPRSLGTETTGGFLYASDRFLYVTLTHYRYNPAGAATDSKPDRHLPDTFELGGHRVLFTPEAAWNFEGKHRNRGPSGETANITLVIDYGLLFQLPAQQSQTVLGVKEADPIKQAPPAEISPANPTKPVSEDSSSLGELRALKDHILKKDMENEALKEEIKALQLKLADEEAELSKLKKRKGKKEQPKAHP